MRNQDSFRHGVIEALPKLDEMAQAGIRAGEVPGLAIALVLQDEVVYAKDSGSARPARMPPLIRIHTEPTNSLNL